MTVTAFKDALLAYIGQEKDLAEAESDRRKSLTRDEKIEEGILLPDLAVVSSAGGPDNNEYGFRLGGDRVRLRVGEVVSIVPSSAPGGSAVKGTVLEVSFDTLVVATGKKALDALSDALDYTRRAVPAYKAREDGRGFFFVPRGTRASAEDRALGPAAYR